MINAHKKYILCCTFKISWVGIYIYVSAYISTWYDTPMTYIYIYIWFHEFPCFILRKNNTNRESNEVRTRHTHIRRRDYYFSLLYTKKNNSN